LGVYDKNESGSREFKTGGSKEELFAGSVVREGIEQTLKGDSGTSKNGG
jgi:hypothetical protein